MLRKLELLVFLAIVRVTCDRNRYAVSSAELKNGSILVQNTNHQEYSRLRELLGLPIGDAKIAAATHGTRRTSKYFPKCPETLKDIPSSSLPGYLKRCPKLQKQEYEKQGRRVSEIILNSKKVSMKNFKKQKKDLIAAVNHLAQLAGPLPSL